MSIFDEVQVPKKFKIYDQRPFLKLKFDFTAHCRIFFTPEKHKDLKNHRYIFYLTVSSPINEIGLGVDFFEIERIYNEKLAPKLNNQVLNQTLPEMNMTAENIAHWLWQSFTEYLTDDITVEQLELYENDDHSVILTQAIMQ